MKQAAGTVARGDAFARQIRFLNVECVMTKSPILWGAGLACALGGAFAGNAVGSTPPLDRSTIAMIYQSQVSAVQDPGPRELLPNHYPLVTMQGTVPVTELATRGLYSQRRYQALFQAADYIPVETEADNGPAEAYAGYQTPGESPPAGDAEPIEAPAQPLQLAAGPATVAITRGGAKLIDVQATLAMR